MGFYDYRHGFLLDQGSYTTLDVPGNTDTNYQGTVHFSSSDSDPGVILPADYTFVSGDQGVHTFAGGFTLVTAGPQTLAATDTANPVLSGTADVDVSGGTAPPPGERRNPYRQGYTPVIEPLGATGSTGNVQPVQRLAAVDRLFASGRPYE